MKIKIPQSTKSGIGGGIRFIQNIAKAIKGHGHVVVDAGEYDILLIAGATLCERKDFYEAKEKNKPIILRVDNILEDGKNRNSGMPRLREYAQNCDVVIYQSEWARKILSPLCGNGAVIRNGVDTDIFFPAKIKNWNNLRIFYSKFSRNETKQFHEVIYWWREYSLKKQDDTLVLVGRYADDKLKIDHPFEFHNEENYEYLGVIQDPHQLADIMRSCDIAILPYQFDACSNTIIEAQACGLPVIYSPTGGAPEIIEYGIKLDHNINPVNLVKLANLEKKPDFRDWKNIWGLERMGDQYHGLFKIIKEKTYEL